MLAKDTVQKVSKILFIIAICILGYKFNSEIANDSNFKHIKNIQLKMKNEGKQFFSTNTIFQRIKTFHIKTKESCSGNNFKKCNFVENLPYIFLVFSLGAVVNHKKMLKIGIF